MTNNTPHTPTDDGELHELARTYRRELADIGIKFTGYKPKSEAIRLVNIAIDEADAKHELAIHQYGDTRAVKARIELHRELSHPHSKSWQNQLYNLDLERLSALTQPQKENK